LPGYIVNPSNSSASSYSQSQYPSHRETVIDKTKRDDIYQPIGEDESWKNKNKNDEGKSEGVHEGVKQNEGQKDNEFKFEFDTGVQQFNEAQVSYQ